MYNDIHRIQCLQMISNYFLRTKEARNLEFFRAGEVIKNKDTSINM